MIERVLKLALAGALAGALNSAAAFEAAVIYDMGGKFDKSFNEAAYKGAEMFKKETGIEYKDFEPSNESQYEQALSRFARRGADVIIAIGFSYATPLAKVADEFPKTKFVIIDSVVDKPNVQSVVFKEHEGSFLVGMLAALKSQTGKIGFIGGMDVPLIRKFALGYEEGAKYVNPKVEVLKNMTGTTPAAWNDPIKAGELAKSQFDRGADVIFAAAGASGMGVLQAAKDGGKLAIGVDSNQNHIHPGSILTSMVKGVDLAVYQALKDAKDGNWKPGKRVMGLAEKGVDYAVDDNNRALISAEMQQKVEAAKADIIAGKLKVTDYFDLKQ